MPHGSNISLTHEDCAALLEAFSELGRALERLEDRLDPSSDDKRPERRLRLVAEAEGT